MNLPLFQDLKKYSKSKIEAQFLIPIAVLSDTSSQLFVKALKGFGKKESIEFDIYESDYDQIHQEILNSGSEFHKEEREYVIILTSTEKLLELYRKTPITERHYFGKNKSDFFENLINNISGFSKVILNTYPRSPDSIFGNYSSNVESSFNFQLSVLNLELKKMQTKYGNTLLCDIEALQNFVGIHGRIDPKFYIKGNMAFRLEFLPLLTKNYLDIIRASKGIKLNKCLILDLDNTTWGGIIGDDGIEGIHIGNLGIGKAFDALQQWAKDLKNRGIIICICSKNTESIAKEPFEKHPDMTLRMDDISVFVANWENKADNIRYIQEVLNIGFDSMVFLDDNPFERNLVIQELPEVTVPELPADPVEYMPYIQQLNLFETASYTEEDDKRTKRYQEEAIRLSSKRTYGSIDEYLVSLQMNAEIKSFDTFSVPRVSQLTQRSNQFNLRTQRYSEEDIKQIMESEDYLTLQVNLSDKYGEYGIVSLLIGKIEGDTLFIDTWIMSCRVLKRGVELFLLNNLVEKAKELGLNYLVGEYIPTPKNDIVSMHYSDLGFIETDNKNFTLDLSVHEPLLNKIKIMN